MRLAEGRVDRDSGSLRPRISSRGGASISGDLGSSRELSDLDLVGQHRLCERVHGARKDATPPKRLGHPDVSHDEAAGVRGMPRAHGRGELQLEGDEDLLGLVPNRQLIRPRGRAGPLQSA